MAEIKSVFEGLIEELKAEADVLAIYLIGSAVKTYPDFNANCDIDILVLKSSGKVMREVKCVDGVDFDLVFYNKNFYERVLAKKDDARLALLNSAKIIYATTAGEELLAAAKQVYASGRPPITQDQIDYIRFNLSNKLSDLERRLKEDASFHYLANIYIEYLIRSYYLLHNLWQPRRKKLMKNLFKYDIVLYELLKNSFTADVEERFEALTKICHYILKPFGGELYELERMDIEF